MAYMFEETGRVFFDPDLSEAGRVRISELAEEGRRVFHVDVPAETNFYFNNGWRVDLHIFQTF